MADEDLILDGHAIADETVALDLAACTDPCVLLNLNKRPDPGFIANLAAVQVDEGMENDMLAEPDVRRNPDEIRGIGLLVSL